MRRLFVILLVLASLPGDAFAQYRPNGPVSPSFDDPRGRRALREQAVAYLGTEAARGFVETPYGDEACRAIFACPPHVARQLAELHASGDLDKLSRPRELLVVIAQHGEDAAVFVIRHPRELQDRDSLDAFLACPLDIALGLKRLDMTASEFRARRLATIPPPQPFPLVPVLVCGGVILLCLLICWKRRQAAV